MCDDPRVRLAGLHAGEVCKLSRQTVKPALTHGRAIILHMALKCVRLTAGAPSTSQRRSSGAHACANATRSYMCIESVPTENLFQLATPSGKAPSDSRKDAGGGSIIADLVERIAATSR